MLSVNIATAIDDTKGPILVTIKPLYSLVAHLTDGVETPVLLMTQAQSPHHYNMRPSERRLLGNARMIIWVGPQMETYLNKVISQQNSIKVQAIQAKGLHLLATRKTKVHQHSDSHSDPGEKNTDPHIWLSTDNAIAISKHIAEQLILSNPAQTKKYENNLHELVRKITKTAEKNTALLRDKKQPFLSYHDAFQYFESDNQLNHIDSIVFNEETGVSLKQLRKIKSQIEKHDIQCIVFQMPRPDIINTLSGQHNIRSVALDPLGLDLQNNKDAWFEIIEQTTLNFRRCLTP